MDSRVSPIESAKKVVEVITIAHTEFVPPEALGFSVYDDAVVPALSSSFRASASSSSAPSSSVPRPAADASAAPDPVPAAAGEQELPVADREVGVEVREVLIDGVKLDSNSSLNTLRRCMRHPWTFEGRRQGQTIAKTLGTLASSRTYCSSLCRAQLAR